MPEWLDALSEDLRSNETLGRYKTVEDLATGLLESKARGSQSILIPSKEAGTEARTGFLNKIMVQAPELVVKPSENLEEFYKTAGRPDEATGYQNPEKLPEIGEELETQLRDIALSSNMTQDQYGSYITTMADMQVETKKINKTMTDEAMAGLKGDWGMAFDERLAAAEKINGELYPDTQFESLSPTEIKGRYETSERLVGKPQAPGQPDTQTQTLTPMEAKRRANEIMQNKDYWDAGSPNQRILIQQHKDLLLMAGMTDNIDGLRAPAPT